MKTSAHYTLFENYTELEKWLAAEVKKVTRKVKLLQVHHTASPSYKHWATDNALRRQENMRSFHIGRGFGDIAQQFTVFPDGTIANGRSLNKAPCGITGANTGAICVEIYGNFDKGQDVMNAKQKEAVIVLYALMCKYFKLTPSTTTIRPHAWYTAKGVYLGNYIAGKSTKTCPGTNFMGVGNSSTGFPKFVQMVKDYMDSGKIGDIDKPEPVPPTKVNVTDYQCTVNTESLNVRKGDSTQFAILTTIKKGEYVMVTHRNSANTWVYVKTQSGVYGWVSKAYLKKVVKETKPVEPEFTPYLVVINTNSLNVRKGPGTNYGIVTSVKKGGVYTIVDEQNGWGLLKSYQSGRNGWISLSYTKKK